MTANRHWLQADHSDFGAVQIIYLLSTYLHLLTSRSSVRCVWRRRASCGRSALRSHGSGGPSGSGVSVPWSCGLASSCTPSPWTCSRSRHCRLASSRIRRFVVSCLSSCGSRAPWKQGQPRSSCGSRAPWKQGQPRSLQSQSVS